MGLFSMRRSRGSQAWHPDEHGVSIGSDIGGDAQVTDSFSVRLLRDDTPGSMITVSYYGARHASRRRAFTVRRHTEWLVCDDPADPGGTETWSAAGEDDLDFLLGSPGEAWREASGQAEADLAAVLGGLMRHDWDGQPFDEGAG